MAEVGQRHRRGDAGVADDDDAQRLHVAERGGGHQHAELLAFLQSALQRGRPDDVDDALDLVGVGAELAQDRADRLALFDDDRRSLQSPPPLTEAVVFGISVTFSGTTRGSKPK